MMNIEQELKEMDFSRLSKVKDSLFKSLIQERAAGRVELYEEDLDFLAAAGNNVLPNDKNKNNSDK